MTLNTYNNQSPDLRLQAGASFGFYMEWQLCHEVHDMTG